MPIRAMIATLQRFIACTFVLIVALCVALAVSGSRLELVTPLALLTLTGHAWVLGLEFLLAREVNRRTGDRAANVRDLCSAWWQESWAAPRVFLWRQPFFQHRWKDQIGDGTQSQRGVVLVHGFVCNRGIWNPWMKRLRGRQVPFVAVDLEPIFGSIDDYVPIIEDAVSRLERATGYPPVVVAHSMGGLAVRKWLVEQGSPTRLHRLITLATPHHGTWLARFAFVTNARQMRRQSPWRDALERREDPSWSSGLTAFYSECDNIVFPTSTACVTGADNRLLTGTAHVEMVDRPEPYEELLNWLADGGPPQTESAPRRI